MKSLTNLFASARYTLTVIAAVAAIYCSSASAANVLFVVNAPEDPLNPGTLLLNSSDAWIKSHFSELLHTVTVVDDDAVSTSSADGQGLIFISSSVDATKVGTKFTNTNVPLVTFDVESQGFLAMTGTVAGTDYGFTDDDRLHIENKHHPLAGGLNGNRNTVQKNVAPMGWGLPNANADVVARLVGGFQPACVYSYEAGDLMIGTQVAPERRIFFFMQDSVQLNDNGIKLFDALVAYSLSVSPSSATVETVDNAAEPATTGHFKISRAGSVANPLTVNYTVAGTATAGTDYVVLSGSVTIPVGSNNAVVDVTPIDDVFAEGDETVLITITTGSGYNVGVVKNATVTIVDDEVAVIPTVNAGPDVFANALFTQTGTVTGALTIQWSQVSGPGTITFGSANAAETTISASAEGVYVVQLSATGNTGAVVTDTATITWDTTNPTITTVYGDLSAEATSPAGAAVTYPAAATNDNLSPVTVTYSHASGSTFALGTTTVTVTATDAAGNSAIDTFDVTVVDTTGPAITVPADVTAEATGTDGAEVTFALPSATDLVDLANVTVTTSPISGSTFALGTTAVTITAKDTRDNTSTATFNVIVVDTGKPVIAPYGDITAEATSAAGAAVTFPLPTATDIADANVVVTTNPASGSTFALGTTLVTITATDASMNSSTATFNVTVEDTTPPVITVPDTIRQEPADANGAVVTFTATATDLVSAPANITIVYSHNSGDVFPIGTTTVTVTATDEAGNEAEETFDIIIGDATPPVITVSNQTVEATGPTGAAVTFAPAPSAIDAVDGAVAVTLSHASGSTFVIGTTEVTATATDAAGNVGTAKFNVTVTDLTGPAITGADDITAEATGPNGAAVTFTLTATDLVDGAVTVTADPASGSTFALGTTEVEVSATDTRGNNTTVKFTVTVEDATAPVVTAPADISVEATGPNGAAVTFTFNNATDLVDGTVTVTSSHVSGSTFPIGQTTVTLSATDAAGNEGTATFKISVIDGTAPLITPPADITAEATGPNGAIVTFTLDPAVDLVDGDVTVTADPASGSTFALGETVVALSATDSDNNTSTASFKVTVVDTTAPAITAPADITAEATGPNGATVSFNATAADLVDGAVTVTADPASGSVFALGTTTVTLTATDAEGNEATAEFDVTVEDTTAPVIANVPANITIEADNLVGMAVSFGGATATDVVSTPTIAYSPASGSVFAIGTTTVTITATDAANNSSTETFTVEVTPDVTPPDIQSGPTAVPNPAKINQTVTFSCTSSSALTWDWEFGDGATSNGKSTGGATHAYPAAGTYTAKVIAIDASGLKTERTLQMIVDADAPVVPPIDTDDDGIPDEFDSDDDNDGATDIEEGTAGSDPLDANSVPKKPMTITKIAGSAKFNTPGRDQYTVAGIIPNLPTTFVPAGKTITVDLGGAIGVFKLDAKGRAKTSTGNLRLKLKYKRNKVTKKKDFVGGNVQFQAKLKGALGEKWKDEGVDPDKDKKKVILPFVTDFSMDGVVYTDKPNTVYSSKAKKSGAIKFSRKIKLR